MKLPRLSPRLFLLAGALLVLIACVRDSDTDVVRGVSVQVLPESVTVKAGDELMVEVRVDPDGRGVSGGELNFAFDPQGLTLVKVEAGNLFGPDPLVGIELVDNVAGTLTYALARRGSTTSPTPTSIFAELTFQVSETAAGESYILSVANLGLADEDFQDIAGVNLASAAVNVQS